MLAGIASLLFSRVGLIGVAVMAGGMAIMYIQHGARVGERAKCKAAAMAAENAALRLQASASEAVAMSALDQAEETAQENENLQGILDAIENSSRVDGCKLDGDVLKRLQP